VVGVRVVTTSPPHQNRGDLGEYLPVPILVRVGQICPSHQSADAHAIAPGAQTRFDIPEASAIGQLRENHRCEVVEDAQAPGLTRQRKLLRAAGDLLRIDASQNLGEDSGTGVHATSATAAEVPGKIESRTSSKSLYHIIICR